MTSTTEPRGIPDFINSLGLGWSLCFVGEDQAGKLGTLTKDLRAPYSDCGDGKHIPSGFSYWGIGPTIAWLMACRDRLYPVMNESTRHFSSLWARTKGVLARTPYHYVSLGVGTGEKDNAILATLCGMGPAVHYFPVDMSAEMLRVGAREATRGTPVVRNRLLPVQIDFSADENVKELRSLLDRIVGEEPILFSLLGNTLSNFEDDTDLLNTIAALMKTDDRLLLEVAYTDSLAAEAQREAAAEYDRSRMFKEFVTSSLVQNTDITVELDDVAFSGSPEGARAILIKTLYRNQSAAPVMVTLPDRTKMSFVPNDTIRLSTMRKYTDAGIEDLVGSCHFNCLSRVKHDFPIQGRRFRFGTEVLLLQRSEQARPSVKSRWDIFIAHAGADRQLAEALYDGLSGQCEVFLDCRSLRLGDKWDDELPKAQRSSLLTTVLVSTHTNQAYYEREEIAAAIAFARQHPETHRVIPLYVGDVDVSALPYGLQRLHGRRLRGLDDVRQVADDLVALLRTLR